MIVSEDQNQFPSSFPPLRDILKALMFLLNLNDFNSSPSPSDQGFAKSKVSSKVWKEKATGDSIAYSLSLSLLCFFVLHYFCVLLYCFELV